jgi:hypothetical protein
MNLLVLLLAVATTPTGPSVGLPAKIEELVLPGTELRVKPITDRRTPMIVRILAIEPHGTAKRYTLEYTGFEPGQFDLRPFLERKDGSTTNDLPEIPVRIFALREKGQILPNQLESRNSPFVGGYWILLTLLTLLWLVGLCLILFVGRKKKSKDTTIVTPRSLADKLRPLIEAAVSGKAATTTLADLERSLIVYWSRRLELAQLKPIEAMAQLRQHAEAGPLLKQLEQWLHQPSSRGANVDVGTLLAPYANLPVDTLG